MPKPVDAFVRGRWEPGFKFLPVNYEGKFEDYYLPAVLEATNYPNLIKKGERVSTIAVPTVLVAFNWPKASNHYQRVARFVDYLFSRIDKLQAPGFDPKWKSINLGATVPGLDRFSAAQEWLDRKVRGAPSFGTGAAFTGDVVRLLQSLPEEGDIAVRLSTRTGAAQDGHFLLGGLKMVREKVAVACKWPQAVARPRN